MEVFEAHGVFITIGISFLGFIVTCFGSYLKFLNEFNFIKGQLSQILEVNEEVAKLIEKHAKIEGDVHKTIKDLDKAFLRIKVIEHKILGVAL